MLSSILARVVQSQQEEQRGTSLQVALKASKEQGVMEEDSRREWDKLLDRPVM